ncbi:hypothetical protein E1B28_002434 [Marasmius oreades]|uniref:Uncharacterized protein n=1 Tax=Marasmius oreades TaxID=181124 RepID=A0A9P7RMU9_9AGAR|nr:uncharacterized protein E1B28_002434 [Marasmius oreades]KAG7086484.1 hypothetical protein E1B28_002434 [Marasmius oreades]
MANTICSAKSGNEWTSNELEAYNIRTSSPPPPLMTQPTTHPITSSLNSISQCPPSRRESAVVDLLWHFSAPLGIFIVLEQFALAKSCSSSYAVRPSTPTLMSTKMINVNTIRTLDSLQRP